MVVGCYVVLRSRRRGGGLTGSPYGGSAGKKDGAIELGMGLGNGHVKGRSGNHGWLSGVVDEKGGLNGFLGGLAGAGAGGAGGANGKVD